MSEYISNRYRQLKIGISSYTEEQLVLDVIGNTNITGVVSATSFVGSASSLTGVTIGIQSEGISIGRAETINFAGAGVSSVTITSDIATVNIKSAGAGGKLEELEDVSINVSNKKDKYILMYDVGLNKYILVNPDDVLSASSTTETTQPGLPQDFIDQLDTVLDNKIDLDAGTF